MIFHFPRKVVAAILAACSLSACAASGASPLIDVPMIPQAVLAGTPPVSNPADAVGAPLRPPEIAYVTSAAGSIFRRRPSERSAALVQTPGEDGYGVCLRSAAASGGHDHALIVFSRRLDGEPISQVDDDTLVLRRAADTDICRSGSITYVTARTA